MQDCLASFHDTHRRPLARSILSVSILLTLLVCGGSGESGPSLPYPSSVAPAAEDVSARGGNRVTLCRHIGNGGHHLIEVNQNAHLGHGDPCPGGTTSGDTGDETGHDTGGATSGDAGGCTAGVTGGTTAGGRRWAA